MKKQTKSILSSTHHPDSQFLHIRDGVQLGARGHDVGILGQQVCLDDAAPVVGRLEMRVLRMKAGCRCVERGRILNSFAMLPEERFKQVKPQTSRATSHRCMHRASKPPFPSVTHRKEEKNLLQLPLFKVVWQVLHGVGADAAGVPVLAGLLLPKGLYPSTDILCSGGAEDK